MILIAPTLIVIIVSFTNGFSLKFPPPGYSLRWYAALIDAWQLHFAALNSLKIALWREETVAAHVVLAEALLQMQDQAAARIEIDRALTLDPKSADALAIRAKLGG